MSLGGIALNALWVLTETAADSIYESIDRVTDSTTNIIVSSSNNLNRSKDPYHKYLFQSAVHSTSTLFTRYYNGLIDIDLDYGKVMENEGYLQMYYSLKEKGMLKPNFEERVPNPEVHDDEVVSRIERVKNRSTIDIIGKMVNLTFDACNTPT